jgi:hypothetical protein
MENRRDDESDAAVLETVRLANSGDAYPTVHVLASLLSRRGLTANEIAAAADRLYRGHRLSVNSDGGLYACD